jgi:hypothetical protein
MNKITFGVLVAFVVALGTGSAEASSMGSAELDVSWVLWQDTTPNGQFDSGSETPVDLSGATTLWQLSQSYNAAYPNPPGGSDSDSAVNNATDPLAGLNEGLGLVKGTATAAGQVTGDADAGGANVSASAQVGGGLAGVKNEAMFSSTGATNFGVDLWPFEGIGPNDPPVYLQFTVDSYSLQTSGFSASANVKIRMWVSGYTGSRAEGTWTWWGFAIDETPFEREIYANDPDESGTSLVLDPIQITPLFIPGANDYLAGGAVLWEFSAGATAYDLGNPDLPGGSPIPEPAGLGLIGLALLAVRKKRN